MSTTSVESSLPNLKVSSAAKFDLPFGVPSDPNLIYKTIYTTAHSLISQTNYALSDNIFTFENLGPSSNTNIDSSLHLWSVFARKNANDNIPTVTQLETRPGALSTVLGFLSDDSSSPIPIFASGATLPQIQSTLFNLYINSNTQNIIGLLPFSFNINTLDYDFDSNRFTSNYVTPLNVAKNLNFNVVTPLSHSVELQHLSLLSLALAKHEPSVFLYDGLSSFRESISFDDILNPLQLSNVFKRLTYSLNSRLFESSKNKFFFALDSLNEILSTNYKPFEYYGHKNPSKVFVTYGTSESESFKPVITTLSSIFNLPISLISVRIPLPFKSDDFVSLIPKSTKSIVLLNQILPDQSSQSILKSNISIALFYHGSALKVNEVINHNYSPDFTWSVKTAQNIVHGYFSNPEVFAVLPYLSRNNDYKLSGKYLFYYPDNASIIDVPSRLAHTFSLDKSSVFFKSKLDNITHFGILEFQLSINSNVNGEVDNADLAIVENLEFFSHSYNILSNIKSGGTILISSTCEKSNDFDAYLNEILSPSFKKTVVERDIEIVKIDVNAVGEILETHGRTKSIIHQVAFLKYANPEITVDEIVRNLWQSFGSDVELLASVLSSVVLRIFQFGLKKFKIPVQQWRELKSLDSDINVLSLPYSIRQTSFVRSPRESVILDNGPLFTPPVSVPKLLSFKESYDVKLDLRPDLQTTKNFIVKVRENKRLTPLNYSRNIFHIDFDITGTGLKYEIGESLGIHGKNNENDVNEFLQIFGIDPDQLVDIPSKSDPAQIEVRTAFQVFSENIDIAGKPPKRFYESLAIFAADEQEKKKLEFLASAGGATELKKIQEEDYYTYTDVFEKFKSARPALTDLVKIIEPLKRREYSIASSQKMHPNSVHLLIVVVDWVDKRGRKRFGQCSKYISDLKVGSELVVSVKPSVMKLPPLTTQPIVMSGLGTGLAPFKAFVEEKLWQKSQGYEIGEIYLYLGSRHRKEEYLYGELWEACKDAGIITHIGAAFSRDQPNKIYIQDRIRESIEDLKTAIVTKNGSFYLCGPTWPVPDITAALEDIVSLAARENNKTVDPVEAVEEMKEAGRYVLEVY
ncbi:sulfite reductase subunit alpha ASCRUDRAFT_9639 [Ascoidea rubescens DSM 1968]|uniref:assimilatory sulfite reductase (NADPH) n=1 Tax=Ascoidea rubescens DSM 1968 TaxID=1344418 RepID=A0A1D2VC12_9ASCO|nr:hypothetical protein ASCRUDRAFT_9639 [Ascoidea rubescens DSM 1968]ODV59244.1 hypothetical protein ASCRUDRAFT_9639 [Ascoidea rubescens DSM 1968]